MHGVRAFQMRVNPDSALVRRIQAGIRRFGYDLAPYTVAANVKARKSYLLQRHGIDLALDVGANVGQFGRSLRQSIGYRGRICSFEPLSEAFAQLRKATEDDPGWTCVNCALGETDGKAEINVAGNLESSSLLPMASSMAEAAPHAAYVGVETVDVKRLDGIFDELRGERRNVFLKLDVQGFEEKVLAGAERSLTLIPLIQMEMSIVAHYEGETPFVEMIGRMRDRGYRLIGLEPGYVSRQNGELQEVDGIFLRDTEVG